MSRRASLGIIFGRTLRQPLAWVSALATALLGALGPGDLVGYASLHLLGPLEEPFVPAASRATELFAAWKPYGDSLALVGRWLLLATLTWLVRAPLVAATFADFKSVLTKGFGRFLRVRRISIMVTGAFAFLPMSALGAWVKQDFDNALPWFGFAALLAMAGGWTALADRYAFGRFDTRQDAIAAQKREEGRHAGPHYLDTSTNRQGYDVATGADSAVTDAGWGLLGSMGTVLAAIVIDVVRFGVSIVAGVVVEPVGFVIYLAAATIASLTTAVLWTAAFERKISARE